MNKLNKKGFTLIEMLVVIAIIAVLVAIIVPTVATSTEKAKGAADAANMRSLTAEAMIDYMDNSKVDKTYTFTSKVYNALMTLTFTTDDKGTLIAKTDTGKTLADFAAIAAEGGDGN